MPGSRVALLGDLVAHIVGQVTLITGLLALLAHLVALVVSLVALLAGFIAMPRGYISPFSDIVSLRSDLASLIVSPVALVRSRRPARLAFGFAGAGPIDHDGRRRIRGSCRARSARFLREPVRSARPDKTPRAYSETRLARRRT